MCNITQFFLLYILIISRLVFPQKAMVHESLFLLTTQICLHRTLKKLSSTIPKSTGQI